MHYPRTNLKGVEGVRKKGNIVVLQINKNIFCHLECLVYGYKELKVFWVTCVQYKRPMLFPRSLSSVSEQFPLKYEVIVGGTGAGEPGRDRHSV